MSNAARKLEPVPDMPEAGEQAPEGERGIPSVNASRAGPPRGVLAVAVLGAVLAAGGLTYMSYAKSAKAKSAAERAKEVQANVPSKTFNLPRASQPPPPAPAPERPQEVPAADPLGLSSGATGTRHAFGGAGGGGVGPRSPSPQYAPPAIDKGASGLMVASASPTAAPTAPVGSPPGVAPLAQRPEDSGPLGTMLKSSSTSARVAAALRNRAFLLPKGTYIDCALQTKIDTTVAGMTMCVVTRDVYSDTGEILLIDRGSQITGEYQANMTQGQARVFVLWNRIKTPSGVVVDLDSPGVDPLGASGVDGFVNNHFLERFGGALMLSLIQDVGAAVGNAVGNAAAASKGGVTLNNTSSAAQGMAAEALKNTINIPPSLVKNQGDRVGILIARDLDFGAVYAMESEPGHEANQPE